MNVRLVMEDVVTSARTAQAASSVLVGVDIASEQMDPHAQVFTPHWRVFVPGWCNRIQLPPRISLPRASRTWSYGYKKNIRFVTI